MYKARWICFLVSLFTFGAGQVCLAQDGQQISFAPPTMSPLPNAAPVFLHGGVEARVERRACVPMQGFGTYQQAWYALGAKQYAVAANYFQMAGDQMEATGGESKFLAEARFAEAQTRKLLGQYDRSKDLYRRSIEIFQKCDPNSFYLKAAQEALKDTTKPLQGQVKKTSQPMTLKAMPIPGIENVSSDVQLSAQATCLDTGVSVDTLHSGDFFNRSRGTLPMTAAVDISEDYSKKVIHSAFLKMNCLETGAVGATNYTAALFYKPITSNGKAIAVGAGSDLLCPTAELKINGKNYKIPMDLPHISPNSRNVMLVTDAKHVLAIDPRTNEAWKLCANFSKKIPDFSWWKLGRQKGRKFS